MSFLALVPIVTELINKFIPDPQAQADAKLKMLEMAQRGELAVLDADLKMALGQIDINKEEAKTDNFRGGWRPAAGWVCVFGLGYQFIVRPFFPWFVTILGYDVPPLPEVDVQDLLLLLGGLLGLGGFRTYERIKGKI